MNAKFLPVYVRPSHNSIRFSIVIAMVFCKSQWLMIEWSQMSHQLPIHESQSVWQVIRKWNFHLNETTRRKKCRQTLRVELLADRCGVKDDSKQRSNKFKCTRAGCCGCIVCKKLIAKKMYTFQCWKKVTVHATPYAQGWILSICLLFLVVICSA